MQKHVIGQMWTNVEETCDVNKNGKYRKSKSDKQVPVTNVHVKQGGCRQRKNKPCKCAQGTYKKSSGRVSKCRQT